MAPNDRAVSDVNAKVLFRVPSHDPDDDTAVVESLWAFDLGEDRYKLDNLPYFAYSVSCGDTVYAPFDEYEGFPAFREVVVKSGNRTVRLYFDQPFEEGNETDSVLCSLLELGCEYEGASKHFFCLNIPPTAAFDAVVEFLIESQIQFEYADPSYEELFPNEID